VPFASLVTLSIEVVVSIPLPRPQHGDQFVESSKTPRSGVKALRTGIGIGAKRESGIFTINPVDSDEVPVTATASGTPGVARLTFQTLGDPSWWFSQQDLVVGRRPDLAVPLALPIYSQAFNEWKKCPGYAIDAWAAYDQPAKD